MNLTNKCRFKLNIITHFTCKLYMSSKNMFPNCLKLCPKLPRLCIIKIFKIFLNLLRSFFFSPKTVRQLSRWEVLETRWKILSIWHQQSQQFPRETTFGFMGNGGGANLNCQWMILPWQASRFWSLLLKTRHFFFNECLIKKPVWVLWIQKRTNVVKLFHWPLLQINQATVHTAALWSGCSAWVQPVRMTSACPWPSFFVRGAPLKPKHSIL